MHVVHYSMFSIFVANFLDSVLQILCAKLRFGQAFFLFLKHDFVYIIGYGLLDFSDGW